MIGAQKDGLLEVLTHVGEFAVAHPWWCAGCIVFGAVIWLLRAAKQQEDREKSEMRARQKSDDLDWAEAHGSRLLLRHKEAGIRGKKLRAAVRKEQIAMELVPLGWVPLADLRGGEQFTDTKEVAEPADCPPEVVYAALDEFDAVDYEGWVVGIADFRVGMLKKHYFGEHYGRPDMWWVILARWRGETVVKEIPDTRAQSRRDG